MNKEQAMHSFFNSFGWDAYDELSVPNDAQFPYITYSLSTDSLGNVCPCNISLWTYSSSWRSVTEKCEEIAQSIKAQGYRTVPFDGGYAMVYGGTPFAQRIGDTDATVKRIYINLGIEYLCGY